MPKTNYKAITLALTIVAVIVAIVALYLQYRKTIPPFNSNGNGPGPEIPGYPRLWDFDIVNSKPEKSILWGIWFELNKPVHLTSLSGQFLIEKPPGSISLKKVGVRGKVVDMSGNTFTVFINEPGTGLDEGWHNFSAVVGLPDIKVFYIVISKWVGGIGVKDLGLKQMIGEALVIV